MAPQEAAPAAVEAPVEVSDAGVEASAADDAAAAKKREENRKKRERQKKKKAADKESAAGKEDAEPVAPRWQTGALPGDRAERRDAGGGTRGLGVFAKEDIHAGEVIAAAPPAISCVFDAASEQVCGFCFDKPSPSATTDFVATLRTASADKSGERQGGFGLKLDDYTPPPKVVAKCEEGEPPGGTEAIITVVTNESPNRGTVHIGDRIVAVDGQPVSGGHEAAVPLLQAAAARNGGCVEYVRPQGTRGGDARSRAGWVGVGRIAH